MFKQIIALLLLVAFALQTFSRAVIVFDYYTNTDTYANNCENKAKPVMHCNGKCQMMKKLKAEEKKDEQNPERKAENKHEVVLSSQSFFPTVFSAPSNLIATFPLFHGGNLVKMPRSHFRPPLS